MSNTNDARRNINFQQNREADRNPSKTGRYSIEDRTENRSQQSRTDPSSSSDSKNARCPSLGIHLGCDGKGSIPNEGGDDGNQNTINDNNSAICGPDICPYRHEIESTADTARSLLEMYSNKKDFIIFFILQIIIYFLLIILILLVGIRVYQNGQLMTQLLHKIEHVER